jgi:uncharacterized membrane protein
MSDLVVIAFETEAEADRVLAELARLQKENLIELEDAAVAIHHPDGKVNLKRRIGGAIGSGGNAVSASLVDRGIDDKFICSLEDTLRPNMSALFVLIQQTQPEKVIAELSQFRGHLLRSSLPPDQEARLQTALSGGGGG